MISDNELMYNVNAADPQPPSAAAHLELRAFLISAKKQWNNELIDHQV